MITAPGNTLKIAAVGDISLGDHPVCAGHGMRSVLDHKGRDVFKDIESELFGTDVSICNIETVASNVGFSKYWLPSFEMRGDPKQLSTIKDIGFNVFGVANNHSMQHGVSAFNDMVGHIRSEGVGLIGLDLEPGTTNIQIIDHDNGLVSGVFAVSTRPEEWTDERPLPYSLREDWDKLLDEVRGLRAKITGFLICSIHWGLEFLESPAPEQIILGRQLIDAGVDVLLGHHPHVLQPVEEYNGGLIFYSLGNFVFDLWPETTKLTAIVKIELEKDEKPRYEIIPVKIGDDFHLYKAHGEDRERIIKAFSWQDYIARDHLFSVTDDLYIASYEDARKSFRYSSYRYFLSNIRKYPLNFFLQSLARTGLRRLLGR